MQTGILAKVEVVRVRGYLVRGETERRESVPAYLKRGSRSGTFNVWCAYSEDAERDHEGRAKALASGLSAQTVKDRWPHLADLIDSIPDSTD